MAVVYYDIIDNGEDYQYYVSRKIAEVKGHQSLSKGIKKTSHLAEQRLQEWREEVELLGLEHVETRNSIEV